MKAILINYKNKKYKSLRCFCKECEINYDSFVRFYRCYKSKLQNFEKVVESYFEVEHRKNELKQNKKYIGPNGKEYDNFTECCRDLGVDPRRARIRKNKNLSQKQIFEPEKLPTFHRPVQDHMGNWYNSTKEMCQFYNISISTYRYRTEKLHMPKEKALTLECRKKTIIQNTNIYYDDKGISYSTISSICKANNLSKHLYTQALNQGVSQKEAFQMARKDSKLVFDHLGNAFNSINAMCKHYHISATTFHEREKKGMSLKECLTYSSVSKHLQPGDKIYLRCGLEAIVIKKFKKNNKIRYSYLIEDGLTYDVPSGQIKEKAVHPILSLSRNSGIVSYMGFRAKCITYENKQSWWECECTICGHKDVLTPRLMINHFKTHAST